MILSRHWTLAVAAAAEAATGLAFLAAPSTVGRLLLGAEIGGAGVPAARVAGIALIALAIACWRGSPLQAMLFYNAAATLYLTEKAVLKHLSSATIGSAALMAAVPSQTPAASAGRKPA